MTSPHVSAPLVWSANLITEFRGLHTRDGVLVRGSLGWGECSPFWEYDDDESVAWLRAAMEAARGDWPEPVRNSVPVNVTIPAVGPDEARELVLGGGGCRTAKVKVGQRLAGRGAGMVEDLQSEIARVSAVREALDSLGPGGRIRVDANGAWSVEEALDRLRALDSAAGGLEYAEQPCAAVEELAELRARCAQAGVDVLIAADESIRRAADPLRVASLHAADLVVMKVQPLGGVRACLALAEKIGLPVVVSSALESSVGLGAGLALAGALPDLPFACGLGTAQLLAQDVVDQPLMPEGGELPVLGPGDPRLEPRAAALAACEPDPQLREQWLERLRRLEDVL